MNVLNFEMTGHCFIGTDYSCFINMKSRLKLKPTVNVTKSKSKVNLSKLKPTVEMPKFKSTVNVSKLKPRVAVSKSTSTVNVSESKRTNLQEFNLKKSKLKFNFKRFEKLWKNIKNTIRHAASNKRRLILTVSLFVSAFVTVVYLLYKLSSFNPTGLQTRTPEEIKRLLFGNDSTLECGTQLNANKPTDIKVVGGRPAVYGEFPWHAVLMIKNGSTLIASCGASVIGNRWLLTAAHCIQLNVSYVDRFILLGSYNFQLPDFAIVHYEVIIIHPAFSTKGLLNDIALIKTAEKIDLTGVENAVAPVCLPEQYEESSGETTVSGFGRLSQDGPSSLILQAANLPIINDVTCKNLLQFNLLPSVLCAGYLKGGIDSCQGDSGGPLVQFGANNRAFLIGIVSWGLGCGEVNSPGVYTQVSHYVDWIYDNIEIYL